MPLKNKCPWCKHNEAGCDEDNCDFKSLKFDKESILKRIHEESVKINDIKRKIAAGNIRKEEAEFALRELLDISAGVQIMVRVLTDEFDVSESEIKKRFEKSDVSKLKLGLKLMSLKNSRGGNSNGTKKSK